MHKNPVISVIIPFTGKPHFLEEAITSVVRQTFSDFELVLVNNRSTEDARDTAIAWTCKLPEKIRLVSEEKKGAAVARNRGILESRGECIAFLDSDDRMKPHRLFTQWEYLKDRKDVALLGSWKEMISPDGMQVIEKNAKPQVPRWASILFREGDGFRSAPLLEPQTSTFFFRKETARKIEGFDERYDPFWLEDTDFVLRMYQVGGIEVLPDSLVEYRTHTEAEEIRRIYDFRNTENHGIFFEKLKSLYLEPSRPAMRQRFRKLASRWLREAGTKIAYFRSGKEISRILLSRARNNDVTDIRNWEYPIRFSLPVSFWPRPFGQLPGQVFDLPDHIDRDWAIRFLEV